MDRIDRAPLSVTLITLNEEENIRAAIDSVRWAEEVIVVDSGSSDRTVEIAQEMGAKVFQNPWSGYGPQKNFAHQKATKPWVLNIDADERVTPQLRTEIEQALDRVARGQSDARGFRFARKTFYLGKWIRHGGWYPNYLVRLVNRESAHWTEPEVHEHLEVKGSIETLEGELEHFTFSGIRDQILTNLEYSSRGSRELRKRGQRPSTIKLITKPFGKFIETYFLKRGFLDGLPGLIISVNAAHSMFLKYAYLIESDIKTHAPPSS